MDWMDVLVVGMWVTIFVVQWIVASRYGRMIDQLRANIALIHKVTRDLSDSLDSTLTRAEEMDAELTGKGRIRPKTPKSPANDDWDDVIE